MSLYKIMGVHPEMGNTVDWAGSQDAATRIRRELEEVGYDSVDMSIMPVPRTKYDLLVFLKTRTPTYDNG